MTRILLESLMITGFVAAMMMLIEYLNVSSRGQWENWLARGRLSQYLLASLLGASPGCLGAFTVVAMYTHGAVSFGAVVAAMIATSGDEAFVMLVLIPKTALALTVLLFASALVSGVVVDHFADKRAPRLPRCKALVLHEEEASLSFSSARALAQWKGCSPARGGISAVLLLFGAAIAAGQIGPPSWNWVRVTLLFVSAATLFVVATVPDHFLEEHLWRHVARKHVPRVFLWTLAALVASGPIERFLQVGRRYRPKQVVPPPDGVPDWLDSRIWSPPDLRHPVRPECSAVWRSSGKFHRAGRTWNAPDAGAFPTRIPGCEEHQLPHRHGRGRCRDGVWVLARNWFYERNVSNGSQIGRRSEVGCWIRRGDADRKRPHFLSVFRRGPGRLSGHCEGDCQIKEVSPQQLKEWMAAGQPFTLIDVREDDEWQAGHAAAALHISRGTLSGRIATVSPDKNACVVLYCKGGTRSAASAATLQKLGYTNVYSLAGGFTNYQIAGLPVQH